MEVDAKKFRGQALDPRRLLYTRQDETHYCWSPHHRRGSQFPNAEETVDCPEYHMSHNQGSDGLPG